MPRLSFTLRLVFLRVVLFAAIGAAATVLVVWGTILGHRAGLRDELKSIYFDGSPGRRANAKGVQRYHVRSLRVDRTLTVGQEVRDELVCIAGFPLLAITGRSTHVDGSGRPVLRISNPPPGQNTGIRVPLAQLDPVAQFLPIIPLLPGFLVDTAVWGVAAFLVWSVPGFVRRRARRRHRRCMRCGYELNEQVVCPECGDAGPKHNVTNGSSRVPGTSSDRVSTARV